MTPTTKLRVKSPEGIISAVPYLLGFHPTDSLVVIALAGSRVTFTARIDLPQPGAPTDEVEAKAAHLVAAVLRQDGITATILIGYGPANRVTPAIDVTRRAVYGAGIDLHDALRVTDGRWFSYTCVELTCCPPEGTPFDIKSSEVAAQATLAGIVALPDRNSLTAQVAPLGGDAPQRMSDAIRRVHLAAARTDLIGRRGYTAVRRAQHRYANDQVLTDDEVAFLTLAMRHLCVRDFAIRRATDHESRLALWTDVTRRAHPKLVAAPATVLAYTAWQQGNGALALVALDRAFEADPDYQMAKIIDTALRQAVPPGAFADLLRRPNRNR